MDKKKALKAILTGTAAQQQQARNYLNPLPLTTVLKLPNGDVLATANTQKPILCIIDDL